MSVRVGIVMDPIAGISYKKDSSLASTVTLLELTGKIGRAHV